VLAIESGVANSQQPHRASGWQLVDEANRDVRLPRKRTLDRTDLARDRRSVLCRGVNQAQADKAVQVVIYDRRGCTSCNGDHL
jgi:hypothetical protein